MATAPPVAAIDADTVVTPLGEGRFGAIVSDRWSVPTGTNGGYAAALMLRAMEAAVGDPDRAPRSVTLHYLRAPKPGPCEIGVTVQRTGARLTFLTASLVQDGKPTITAQGAFSIALDGFADFAEPMPAVEPAPAELDVLPDGAGMPTITQRIATSARWGGMPFSGGDEAVTGGWIRLTEPRVPDAATLAFYADAWLPAPFFKLTEPVLAPTIDLTIHFRAPLPHPGLTAGDAVLARFTSSTSANGFAEEDGAIWAPDGTLLVQSRQLALLTPFGG